MTTSLIFWDKITIYTDREQLYTLIKPYNHEKRQPYTLTDDNQPCPLQMTTNYITLEMTILYPERLKPYTLTYYNSIPWKMTMKLYPERWNTSSLIEDNQYYILTNDHHIHFQMTTNTISWEIRTLFLERWQPITYPDIAQPYILKDTPDRWQHFALIGDGHL